MADSKLPLKRRAPVRNRLPILAEVKLKVEIGGRERFRISRLRRLKKDRISSFFAGGMACQRRLVPETIACHSAAASRSLVEERRWLKSAAIAMRSVDGGSVGMSRTS